MKVLAAVLLLVFQAAPAQSPPAATGSISGAVLHAITGAPIVGARVTLMRLVRVSNEFGGAEPAATTQTDARGRFLFPALPPGGYAVSVEIEGFLAFTDQYVPPGADTRTSRSALISLAPVRAVTDLVFHATPVGVLSGRIVDADGRPIGGMSVAAFRRTYTEYGEESVSTGGEAVTNERGEYRVPVMPRRGYILAAFPRASGGARYGAALYPGTTDLTRAAAIDAEAGATTRLMDFPLVAQRLYAIRGRVVDAASGAPPTVASVWITTTSVLGAETITGPPTYDAATGTFESRVGPGEYRVGVTVPYSPPVSPRALMTPRMPPTAMELRASVSAADVSGLMLRIVTPGASLRGRLSAEGRPLSSLAGWEAVRVRLTASRDSAIRGAPTQVLPMELPAMPDGAFQLFGQMLGEFRVRVSGLPEDAYVQAARFGATDVLSRPLRISEPTQDSLDIVISPRGGRIDGVVTNDASQPAAGALAVLVPADRTRRDLFARATTDEAGRVTFRGVAPGAYKIFAWMTLEPFAYYDEALLKSVDAGATAVQVGESARLGVAIRLLR